VKRALILVAMCACNGVSTHPLAFDARDSDAPPDDAAPTYARKYVIDRLIYPPTPADARAWTFDFNADSTSDNQLGNLFVLLGEQGLAPQTRSDYAVGHGNVLLLAALTSTDESFADGPASFSMFAGSNPQPLPCGNGPAESVNCGSHLDGHAMFDVSPTSAHDPPLTGTLAGGMLVTDPGILRLSIAFGDSAIPLDLAEARVQITTTTDVGASGVIAGCIRREQIENTFIPALASVLGAAILEDCGATCQCISGSNGEKLVGAFDSIPHDCHILTPELTNNGLLRQLLQSDVTLEGGGAATSFGLRFTAVNAAFTP
jgi:hypothetical protein